MAGGNSGLDVTEAADDDWIRRAIFPLLGRWRGVSGVFKGLLPRGFISKRHKSIMAVFY